MYGGTTVGDGGDGSTNTHVSRTSNLKVTSPRQKVEDRQQHRSGTFRAHWASLTRFESFEPHTPSAQRRQARDYLVRYFVWYTTRGKLWPYTHMTRRLYLGKIFWPCSVSKRVLRSASGKPASRSNTCVWVRHLRTWQPSAAMVLTQHTRAPAAGCYAYPRTRT